ncbi:MAG: GGDEF domain-containing protein [Lachnospiraceae bacterium]
MTDVRTLIYALVWESLFATIIILIFRKYTNQERERAFLLKNAFLHILYTIGFFLLFSRNELPLLLSSTIGNPLLFLAFFLELQLMLYSMHIHNRKFNHYLVAVLILSCIGYILQDILIGNANYRVAVSSLVAFMFFFPFILFIVFCRRHQPLHIFAACSSLPLVISAIPRFYTALTATGSYGLYDADHFQTALFLSFLIKCYCTSIFFFLLLKMDADEEIRALAATDDLTGMINRRTYLQLGNKLFNRCQFAGKMIGVFFLDIDSFKMINDKYGHAKGDEVLIAFGKSLGMNLRPQDLCCRYGGDEFSICVQLSSYEIGIQIADRILFETSKMEVPDVSRITTSIGIAYGVPEDGRTFHDYIAVADKAMYLAKKSGKNKCIALNAAKQR